MRAVLSHTRRRRYQRLKEVADAQGASYNYDRLLELLRDHLDRGHPGSQEEADDLLEVAQQLNTVEIPPREHRRVINRLTQLDVSRSVLSWLEVEDALHEILMKVIVRLKHTHPRRPAVPKLPSAQHFSRVKRKPAHTVILDEMRRSLRPGNGFECALAQAQALLQVLDRMVVPCQEIPSIIQRLQRIAANDNPLARDIANVIGRLRAQHAEHIR